MVEHKIHLYNYEKPYNQLLNMEAFYGQHRFQAIRSLVGDEWASFKVRLERPSIIGFVNLCRILEREVRPEDYTIALKERGERFFGTCVESIDEELRVNGFQNNLRRIIRNLKFYKG